MWVSIGYVHGWLGEPQWLLLYKHLLWREAYYIRDGPRGVVSSVGECNINETGRDCIM